MALKMRRIHRYPAARMLARLEVRNVMGDLGSVVRREEPRSSLASVPKSRQDATHSSWLCGGTLVYCSYSYR